MRAKEKGFPGEVRGVGERGGANGLSKLSRGKAEQELIL